jgi:hypothetical protein
VRDLYQRLCADGVRPWLDEEDLLPGQEWEFEISKAVRDSDVVVICLSRAATTKRGFVQREIKFALDIADEQPEGAIFLIPLRLEECDVPIRLQRRQWVDLFTEQGYQRLMRSLKICADQSEQEVEFRPSEGRAGSVSEEIPHKADHRKDHRKEHRSEHRADRRSLGS